MMPQNFLQGLARRNENIDSEAGLLARAVASARGPGHAAAAAPSAALLDALINQEQRRQAALLLSSLGNQSIPTSNVDSQLNALMLQRSLGHQQALSGLSSFASLPAGSDPRLGLMGLGMLPGAGLGVAASAAQQSLLLGGGGAGLASLQADQIDEPEQGGRKGRTGAFPQKLHQMLADLENEEGGQEIASFLPHGRAFAIHKPKEFVKKIMPKYFRMSRFSSFQRQLNLYEFTRITEGPDKGAYFHELFVKGRPVLCSRIKRNKIKGVANGTAANKPPSQLPLGPGLGLYGSLGLQGSIPMQPTGHPTAASFLGSLSGRSL